MNEIWKPIIGYEGLYEISNFGNVKSLAKTKTLERKSINVIYETPEKILSKLSSGRGYLFVRLVKNKDKGKTKLIHRLVAEAFLGCKPNNYQVNHKNFDRSDNRLENLEWCTAKENVRYTAEYNRHLHGERHHKAKLKEKDVLKIRQDNKSAKKLALMFNVDKSNILQIKAMKTWKHI